MSGYRLKKGSGRSNRHTVSNETGQAKRQSTGTENKVKAQAALRKLSRISEQRSLRQELQRTNQPTLAIEGVAKLLQCSVDRIRRIPDNELPHARIGKRSIYLQEDVIAYVRLRIPRFAHSNELDSEEPRKLIDGIVDSTRGRSQKNRRTP